MYSFLQQCNHLFTFPKMTIRCKKVYDCVIVLICEFNYSKLIIQIYDHLLNPSTDNLNFVIMKICSGPLVYYSTLFKFILGDYNS